MIPWTLPIPFLFVVKCLQQWRGLLEVWSPSHKCLHITVLEMWSLKSSFRSFQPFGMLLFPSGWKVSQQSAAWSIRGFLSPRLSWKSPRQSFSSLLAVVSCWPSTVWKSQNVWVDTLSHLSKSSLEWRLKQETFHTDGLIQGSGCGYVYVSAVPLSRFTPDQAVSFRCKKEVQMPSQWTKISTVCYLHWLAFTVNKNQ